MKTRYSIWIHQNIFY